MLILSWQITVVALAAAAAVRAAGALGRADGSPAITRESMQLNAAMSQTMTERFNVSGALLVKIFGRPADESAQFGAKAGRVRDIGITSRDVQPDLLRRAHARRVARDRARLRHRRRARHQRRAPGRDAGRPGRAADPAVRAADVAVQRAGRRHDRAGLLRARLRGARPAADGRRRARRGRAAAPAPTPSSSTTSTFRYPSADEVSLASLESVAVLDSTASTTVLNGVDVHRRAGPDGRPRRPVRRRQDDDHGARLAPLRRHRGQRPGRRPGRARRHPELAAPRRSGS